MCQGVHDDERYVQPTTAAATAGSVDLANLRDHSLGLDRQLQRIVNAVAEQNEVGLLRHLSVSFRLAASQGRRDRRVVSVKLTRWADAVTVTKQPVPWCQNQAL